MSSHPLPAGFVAHVANVGVKDTTSDFVVVTAARPVAAAAVFTRSRFAGPSVEISRRHVADGRAQAVVVVSKNANVANGPAGDADAIELVEAVAAQLGCDPADVLVASTGVIGRRYPMDRLRAGVRELPDLIGHIDDTRDDTRDDTGDDTSDDGDARPDALAVATAMMTTDTHPKVATATIAGSDATVVGVAKGVGMIEPDMATHISLLFTDAAIAAPALDQVFRRVVDRSFNCVSIDSDTSTSDTSAILASGVSGEVDLRAFEAALAEVCIDLTKQIARDGEGAHSLIEVRVDRARDAVQARRVGKAIVNSPLVKTAVHGGDPNWGRVAMAIGKCSDDTDIDQRRVVIRFGENEVYPQQLSDTDLAALSDYMRGDDVLIHVSLDNGDAEATVWGCDLTAEYVRFNAEYTT